MTKKFIPSQKSQGGIVLIVAMIMLVIMSILGISSVRSVALEERMSAAQHDRSIAMQAAEAALLAGEQDARNRTNFPAGFDPDATTVATAQPVVNGFVARPTTQSPDWMLTMPDQATWWQQNARELASTVNLGSLLGNRPRYLIEYRGRAVCKSQNPNEAPAQCDGPNGKISPTCDCYLFRVTARSNPAVGRAEVVLQTLFTTF